ncbi:hypothetical protein [Pseudomonas sp. LF052]
MGEIEAAIVSELLTRKRQVLNRNAYKAFFGMFSDPAGALGHIFLGRKDALDSERSRIVQEKMLEMLVTLDDAFTKSAQIAAFEGVEVDGLIQVKGGQVDHVVGLEINTGAGSVRIRPGTKITAELENGQSLTGIKIGR